VSAKILLSSSAPIHLLHSQKAEQPMEVILAGSTTKSKSLQRAKAQAPMEVILLEILTEANLSHP
jgi:hypothetical protein